MDIAVMSSCCPKTFRRINDLPYLGPCGQHRRQPLEAEQLSLAVARLHDAIGIKRQRLILLQPEGQLVVDRAAREPQRQRARHRQLLAHRERRQVSGVRHGGLAVWRRCAAPGR